MLVLMAKLAFNVLEVNIFALSELFARKVLEVNTSVLIETLARE